jgi:hypothetical protein
MEIKLHGTYLDSMETIQKYVDGEFFNNLNRELEIHSLKIDDQDVFSLVKLGYKEISNFIYCYENGNLENDDLNLYMACLDHGLSIDVDSTIKYVSEKFIESASYDEIDFKSKFAFSKADEYIKSIDQSETKQTLIGRYFNYAGYERDIFLSQYSFIEHNKMQYIFLNH